MVYVKIKNFHIVYDTTLHKYISKLGKKQPHWRHVVAEELYDHFEDPEEIDNTYQSPNYAHIKRNLRRRLQMQFT